MVRYWDQNSRSLNHGLSSTSLAKSRSTLRIEFAGCSETNELMPNGFLPGIVVVLSKRSESSRSAYTSPRESTPHARSMLSFVGTMARDSGKSATTTRARFKIDCATLDCDPAATTTKTFGLLTCDNSSTVTTSKFHFVNDCSSS